MKVGILGGGKWGQALARLVMAAGHEPFIAYRDVKRPPHLLPSTDDPPEVTAACDLILVATSAGYVRNAVRLAKPGARHRVVVAGRGLEPATSRWLTEVVLEESPTIRVGALAGPAPVDEILNGGLCAGVVASPFEEVRRLTTEALHSNRYRLYDSPDLVGVQLAGAMTPVLATLVGVARGLQGSGVGIHAMVLTRGLREASRLARAMGADAMTFAGLAGVGDLVSAQALPGHPNYEAGLALTRGDRSQGPSAISKALVRLAREHDVELPLTEALCAIYDGVDPLDLVQDLMARPATSESGGV
ncbi:MAG: NAD(P)-binding domain-containing protein [Myxococcales bacterium]|nr:NAD(P)-binding domain-containing protein [Myxococcales bacterium]